MIYRFRVTYEDHEDVFRDIEIRSSQSFMELHSAIQQAIAFDNSKPATFYASDDYWRKEAVLASVNTSDVVKKSKGKPEEPPKKKTIADFVDNPHQKFIYIFDPEREWTFTIELLKILPDEKKDYPVCIKTSGTSPKQYKETNLPPPPPEDDAESLKLLKDEKEPIVEPTAEEISEDDDTESLMPIPDGEIAEDEPGEEGKEEGDLEEGEEPEESSEGSENED